MNFKKRTITALILLSIVLTIIQWASNPIFFAFIQLIIMAAIIEFNGLAQRRNLRPQSLLSLLSALIVSLSFVHPEKFSLSQAIVILLFIFCLYFLVYTNSLEKIVYFPTSIALTFLVPFYISFPLNFFYWLRLEYGPSVIYFFLSIIFMGDTGAYLIGHQFGRHRLVPLASPKKTVEGAIGGLFWAAAGATIARFVFWPDLPLWSAFFLGLITHATAQVADPFESLFKRAAGVKDSSNVLPGHGGFLDRVDSLLLATPVYYYLLRLFQ